MSVHAALYARVSTDRQDASVQIPDLERLARARGWTWDLHQEIESGAKRRPVLDAICADARRGRYQAIAVWALDRLGRSMHETVVRVLELDRAGVQVVSVREPWMDSGSPARDLLLAIMAWVAEQERRRLIERTRAGIAAARRRGRRIGRPPATERHAVALHTAAELVAAGTSIRAAAREWSLPESTLRGFLRARGLCAKKAPSDGASEGA